MKCGASGIDIGSWRELPNLRDTPWGHTAACPHVHDSNNRIQIWPHGGPAGNPGMWCRQCHAVENFEGTTVPGKPTHRIERKCVIDPDIPRKHHENLFDHRAYFKKRLISDEVIDEYLLGWNADKNRYSIPCYYEGKLSGIQYRIKETAEAWCKENKIEYHKYISEAGGINNVPFNDIVARQPLLFIFVDEGPLDCLTYRSLGWPCVAPFSGNNVQVGWRWPHLLRHIPEIVIIKQNDVHGAELAEAKLRDLGRGRIISPPAGFKDGGEYLRSCTDPARAMYEWCGLPPVLKKELAI